MRILCLLLLASLNLAAQSTVKSVPNQKLINGSYVSNPDGILDASTVSQIDTLLASLEKKSSVQIAVVALESIGEADIFEFAQNLFTEWKVGSKSNDNGLLLLLVKDQRTVRFHTGYGLEGVLPDITCKRIQRDFMVPEFKNGNYGAGILAGLKEVNKIISDPTHVQEVKAAEPEPSDWEGFIGFFIIFYIPIIGIAYWIKAANSKFADSKNRGDVLYPEMRLTRWGWLMMFLGIPVVGVCVLGFSSIENAAGLGFLFLYFYLMFTLFLRLWRMQKVINPLLKKEAYYEIVEFIRKSQYYWAAMALFFPLPFFGYFFYHLARKRIYRNHPRSCKECQGKMYKLSEQEEDEFLSKEQQMEETLRSVDYDVWKCKNCQMIDMSFYLNRHSKYEVCPKCKTIAYHFVSRRTLESATYSSSGKGEEIHACQYCGYSNKSTYTIDKLTRTTTTTSSGSSFGSSSSSSGGSWGGGRSGGGGASSSW